MGSDFSALDAELDALGPGQPSDAPELAAQDKVELAEVDEVLGELGADLPAPALDDYTRALPLPVLTRPRAPQSEEIVLPEPMLRDPREALSEHSGELALPADGPRSGSFALESEGEQASDVHTAPESETASSGDPLDHEFDELFDMIAEASPMGDPAPSPVHTRGSARPPYASGANGAFGDPHEQVTRQSSIPSGRFSTPPAPSEDDTDTFDSSSFGFVEAAAEAYPPRPDDSTIDRGETFDADELDSAEFEILPSVAPSGSSSPAAASSSPPPASTRPEKRPSFLGRLFGRREE